MSFISLGSAGSLRASSAMTRGNRVVLGTEVATTALSITRNEFNHVVLECRTAENCQHIRIIRALGFTNEHVYAETPDWLINRLSRVEIHGAEAENPRDAGC